MKKELKIILQYWFQNFLNRNTFILCERLVKILKYRKQNFNPECLKQHFEYLKKS